MDESTDGVTTYTAFVFFILDQYRGMERVCAPLFAMTRHLDRTTPYALVPISLYHDVCNWIEDNLGVASVRDAGRKVGAQVLAHMRTTGTIGTRYTPNEVLDELTRSARVGVQDPRGRGWELLDSTGGRVVMRRTQTFHCILQEGLLLSLVEPSGVLMPRVDHRACTRRQAPFCEYEVRWLVKKESRAISVVGR